MKQLSNKIVKELEGEILAGRLPSGERLPSEEKLCGRFEASRTVIREAIQQLRGRGLLRSEKGSGTYIAAPSLESLGSAVETYSALIEEAGFLDLIDFRILIESECAKLAAERAGERVISNLRRIIENMEKARGSRTRFSETDIAFHLTIAKASGNEIYAILLAALEKRCIDYAQTNRGHDDWYDIVIDQHRDILVAIESGHPQVASDAMRKHLLSSRRHFVDLKG
ncbi:FadR/GntR family transcriptional regulator [Haloferula sp.]|uniref:FadR/GntR family transcriptional regulator n=1 Tax=Haloferula sp. TaxID=2497595 RepID=UPI003C70C281